MDNQRMDVGVSRAEGRLLRLTTLCVCLVLLVGWPAAGEEPLRVPADTALPSVSASERVAGGIREPGLRELAEEILEYNPGLAAAEARARAAVQRAPQVRALPDPVAGVTAFVETPETRTGPQRLTVAISQGLPWLGKLSLKERSTLDAAMALEATVDSKRLTLVTEARRLFYELAFLESYREITEELRVHFLQHEEIARARYSTGTGFGQGVLKLQAEITRTEKELLDIDTRRIELGAQFNALRDRPSTTPLPARSFPITEEIPLDLEALRTAALRNRPDLRAADAKISQARTGIRLAEKEYRPDFKVGLTYTIVGSRDDTAGRLLPPEGNGDDIFGIQGGVAIPVWRRKLAAGVEEAVELETAAEEDKRDLVAMISASVSDLAQRVPLTWRQLRLVEDLLIVQAEEALDSAQAGYVSGILNALDLLDAEHVLFEAQTAVARAKADYLIGLAKLEGAVGAPLQTITAMERSES